MLKHPCLTSGPDGGKCPHFNNCRNQEPCKSCPLPGQYDDALKQTFNPSMAFMRDSSQFNRTQGMKREKRKVKKREMEEKKVIDGHGPGKHLVKELDTDEYKESPARDIKYKICTKCKQKKELNEKNFGRHAKTRDGFANTCRDCRSKTMTERNKYSRAALVKEKIEEKEKVIPKIELDFTDHLTIYREICKAAEDRLRSPENQIMWWLINSDFEKLEKDKQV